MAERKSQIAKDILRRVQWLYAIFLLVAIAIFLKVLWIQYGPEGAELREKAQKITFERVALKAERGDILAADGRILATSVPTYEIRMDFNARGLTDTAFNNNVDSLAWCLANFFKDKSKSAYKTMLVAARADRTANQYKMIAPRRVDYLEEKQIARFPILRNGQNRGGYIKVPLNRRVKPYGSLAERSIGMVNQSGVKLGIEGAFDEQLSGTDGTTLMQRVSGSFRVPVDDPLNVEPVNGLDVVTTFNVDLQDVAESALKRQLEVGEADWGTVVLMEVATGEIHAMSNLTRTAPGVYREDFNYAIGRRMEPGSTFKLASLIALLEDAGMSIDDKIDCRSDERRIAKVGGYDVRDDHREQVITLRRVFEVSSNIGFARAVYDHYDKDRARYVNFIKGMGLGDTLGIVIGGEKAPLIKDPAVKDTRDPRRWDGMTLGRMAYGYALELTPMHTLTLYNAVANGGRMMRPKMVREIQSYGQTVRAFPDEVINPAICSPKTVQLARECLMGVVDEGTGRILKSDFYEVAAKTGTAQVPFDRGGYTDRYGGRNYLATMVGYFPADNPKYSCIVAIKTYNGPGRRSTYYGASLSGPVFRAIADRVYASNSSWHAPVDNSGAKRLASANDIKNGNSRKLKEVAGRLGVKTKIDRHTPEWISIPDHTAGRADSTVMAADDFIEVAALDLPVDGQQGDEAADVANTVPSVVGMGLRDALYLLESRGLTVAFSGTGTVKSQSIPAGTMIAGRQVIRLVLSA